MARPKLTTTKSVYLKCRVEPTVKNDFESLCKKIKIKPANYLRDIILKELNNEK